VTRVVLLGASNVTLGFGVLTRLIRGGFAGPIDLRAALGHGRSYGVWSSLLVRSLPAITQCGLWEGLRLPSSEKTYALVTDVGNDLMYGFSPEQIEGWVATCFERLGEAGARTTFVRLPIARVERLGAARYHATRFSFFPGHKPVAWTEMLRRARELDERAAESARRHGAEVVTPPLEWYGFDPIHIRWRRRPEAWRRVLSAWPGWEAPQRSGRGGGVSLLGRMPERYRLFGRERGAMQPVVVKKGMAVSLY
jgi:hypothetical protein